MFKLVLILILWNDPTQPLTSEYQEREIVRNAYPSYDACMRELHRWHAVDDWRNAGVVVREIPEAEGDARWEVAFASCEPSAPAVS